MTKRETAVGGSAHWTRLDPRPAVEVGSRPIADSVNIPLDEIPRRVHELPPKDEIVDVVGPRGLGERTVGWLGTHGRVGRFSAVFDYAEPGTVAGRVRLWRPSPWLDQIVPELAVGRALDLACGTGRDAVYLASLGWRVTAVDVLADALELGKSLEERYVDGGERIDWIEADLERGDPPKLGRFDLVVGFRYLHRPLFAQFPKWLNPGGHVVYETFTTHHLERNARPSRAEHLLEPGELPALLSGMIVRRHEESWRAGGHTARIWATSPG